MTIFQRGAMDGLAAVQPLDNPFLQRARPGIFLPCRSDGEEVLDMNDEFGLSPYLVPLKSLLDDGQISIVHREGIPFENRSHFDMQDFMESGTPGKKSTRADG